MFLVCIEASLCAYSDYKCSNGRCVADTFACDGHNNCGDSSDEKCGECRVYL